MDLLAKIEEMREAGEAFDAVYKNAYIEKVARVILATNALKLEGMSKVEVRQYIDVDLESHVADHMAHDITLAQTGAIAQTVVNTEVGAASVRIPEAAVPFSRYGSLNYLPVGVSGSFEGSLVIPGLGFSPMVLEADDTLVYLRTATNGSNSGVYYSYMRDARSGPVTEPIRTTRRYRPSYFPIGQEALYTVASSPSVVFGRLQDSAGLEKDYFISLTYGTMDDTLHRGGLIDPNIWGQSAFNGCYFVWGDRVYCVAYDGTSAEFSWTVRTILVSDIEAGGYVTFQTVGTITSYGLHQTVAPANSRIVLAPLVAAGTAAEKPMIIDEYSQSHSFTAIWYSLPEVRAYINPNDPNKARFYINWLSAISGPYGGSAGVGSLSFVYDKALGEVRLDGDFANAPPARVYARDGDFYPIIEGWLYNTNEAWELLGGGNCLNNSYHLDDQTVFCIVTRSSVGYTEMHRGHRPGGATSAYEGVIINRERNPIENRAILGIGSSFGSAIGAVPQGGIAISEQRWLLYAQGLSDTGFFSDYIIGEVSGTPDDYLYQSYDKMPLSGFAPNTYRRFLKDLRPGFDRAPIQFPVTEIVADPAIPLRTHGARIIIYNGVPRKTECASSFGPNMEPVPGVTVTPTALNQLYTAIGSLISDELGMVSATTILVDFTIPQISNVPPFALVTYRLLDTSIWSILVRVNITAGSRDTVISGLAITSHYANTNVSAGIGWLDVPVGNEALLGAHVIYEKPTEYWIGFNNASYSGSAGGAFYFTMRFKYDKVAGDFVFTNGGFVSGHDFSSSWGTYFATKQLGFGKWTGTIGNGGDVGTKANFGPIDEVQWNVVDQPSRDKYRVLVAQDVAQGWVVYFTEETPIFLNGRSGVLPVQSIDISALPWYMNATLYIYIVDNGVGFSYVIDSAQLPDLTDRMYVGIIETDSLRITSIAMDKVTRLGLYRPSLQRRGQSIPVSGGSVWDENIVSHLEWI